MTEETEEERLAQQDKLRAYVMERVIVDPLSGCWEWQKAKSPGGYGVMRWGPKVWRAHRCTFHYLCRYLHKAEPVHHKCANRCCVNPNHLQAVSHHDNVAEMLGRSYLEDEIEGLRIELDETTGRLQELETLAEWLLDHYEGVHDD